MEVQKTSQPYFTKTIQEVKQRIRFKKKKKLFFKNFLILFLSISM
ncbi:hypothetical protein RV14_GL000213 [Enterococcus ratti]|uniref:Uncharacterized protein n=1 Tax=Enterococcus ratti TaxID=150033 RepID=A0A1L8WKY5_9ENTE|nr:hypothetical protein RV14_GL000213 [Enterococcus ratti]